MNKKTRDAAQTVWHYHQLRHELTAADIVWVLGSHDLRVADRAAELWHEELAPLIVMSGGFGNFTEGVFDRTEAELLADRAVQLGVPREVILIEKRSTNTGENVAFTRDLLVSENKSVSSAIAVQKPYMERRTYATVRAQWPEISVQVTSPRLGFDAYCAEIPRDRVISIMVGDLQRIIEYPKRGFMTGQHVPDDVMDAMRQLIAEGYDAHLLPQP